MREIGVRAAIATHRQDLAAMAWYIERSRIAHVWYPVFPPDTNGEAVLTWLRARS